MAARGVYRAVEDIIDQGGYSDLVFPHTNISRSIRYALRENRDFAKIYSIRCISDAAFSGITTESMNASIKAWSDDMGYVLDTIPYIKKPKVKNAKTVDEEREEAVKKYLEYINSKNKKNQET